MANKLPVFRIESARADSPARSAVDSAVKPSHEEDAMSALVNMKFNKREAPKRVQAGLQKLGPGAHPLGEVVRAALASGVTQILR